MKNLKMEGERCLVFSNGCKKRGIIEFVDDVGSVFIKFNDGTYLGLTPHQVKEYYGGWR